MIGVFGGTFDPIHNGHIRCMLDCQKHLGLAKIRVIPSFQPPHRDQPKGSVQDRVAMVRLAIQGHQGLVLDDREIQRQGASYMVDTLASLQAARPDEIFCLLLGEDAFAGLTRWHEWQQLFSFAHLIVLKREAYSFTPNAQIETLLSERQVEDFALLARKKPADRQGRIYRSSYTLSDLSGTAIRHKIAENKGVSKDVPEKVNAYIQLHTLYQRPYNI